MAVTFKDYSAEVIAEINDITIGWLYEVGGEVEHRAAEKSPHDTGALQQHWATVVDEEAGECQVGNDLEYAIYQEFGTGIHALDDKGRKDVPWGYISDKDGKYHITYGSKPHRMLWKAFNEVAPKATAALEKKLGGLK